MREFTPSQTRRFFYPPIHNGGGGGRAPPPIRRIEQTERERREREEERIMACGNDHTVAGDLIGVVSMTVLAITVVSALV